MAPDGPQDAEGKTERTLLDMSCLFAVHCPRKRTGSRCTQLATEERSSERCGTTCYAEKCTPGELARKSECLTGLGVRVVSGHLLKLFYLQHKF